MTPKTIPLEFFSEIAKVSREKHVVHIKINVPRRLPPFFLALLLSLRNKKETGRVEVSADPLNRRERGPGFSDFGLTCDETEIISFINICPCAKNAWGLAFSDLQT